MHLPIFGGTHAVGANPVHDRRFVNRHETFQVRRYEYEPLCPPPRPVLSLDEMAKGILSEGPGPTLHAAPTSERHYEEAVTVVHSAEIGHHQAKAISKTRLGYKHPSYDHLYICGL